MAINTEPVTTPETLDEARENLAFFIPERHTDQPIGRSMFIESQSFQLDNEPLLPKHYGLVASQQTEIAGKEMTGSVVFDARSPRHLVWQVTTTESLVADETGPKQEKGRTVVQLAITSSGKYDGWRAIYAVNGRLTGVADLEEAECIETWQEIKDLVGSEENREAIEKINRQREKQEMALEAFALTRVVKYIIPAADALRPEQAVDEYVDRTTDANMIVMESILSGEQFKKELEKKRKTVSERGFVTIVPQPKPEPAEKEPTSSTRPTISGKRQHWGSRMLTPIWPLRTTEVANLPIDGDEARRFFHVVPEQLDLYLPLKEIPSRELDAQQAVTKALAYAALTKQVTHWVHQHENPVFPNGLYRMGSHFYRRDETGFYVIGLNRWRGWESQGQEAVLGYLTLVPFQRLRRNFAPDSAWAELAQDVLGLIAQEPKLELGH